jgi:hypothetical protein
MPHAGMGKVALQTQFLHTFDQMMGIIAKNIDAKSNC